MKETDKAYFAGIVDGEGCISVRKATSRNCTWIRGSLHICMSNKPVLEYLASLAEEVGVLCLCDDQRAKRNGWKPMWHWVMSTQQAAKILKIVLPYLRVKRVQAELLIELASIRDGHNGRVKNRPERQLEIMNACKALNHRGRVKAA